MQLFFFCRERNNIVWKFYYLFGDFRLKKGLELEKEVAQFKLANQPNNEVKCMQSKVGEKRKRFKI
jgi:hypothetical protein